MPFISAYSLMSREIWGHPYWFSNVEVKPGRFFPAMVFIRFIHIKKLKYFATAYTRRRSQTNMRRACTYVIIHVFQKHIGGRSLRVHPTFLSGCNKATGKKKPVIDGITGFYNYLVPKAGLEPARVSPLRPQHSVSTSSTTSAALNIRMPYSCLLQRHYCFVADFLSGAFSRGGTTTVSAVRGAVSSAGAAASWLLPGAASCG